MQCPLDTRTPVSASLNACMHVIVVYVASKQAPLLQFKERHRVYYSNSFLVTLFLGGPRSRTTGTFGATLGWARTCKAVGRFVGSGAIMSRSVKSVFHRYTKTKEERGSGRRRKEGLHFDTTNECKKFIRVVSIIRKLYTSHAEVPPSQTCPRQVVPRNYFIQCNPKTTKTLERETKKVEEDGGGWLHIPKNVDSRTQLIV